MIRYFVSNSGLSLPRPIRSIEDVTALADELQTHRGLSNVVILNWRRFEDAE